MAVLISLELLNSLSQDLITPMDRVIMGNFFFNPNISLEMQTNPGLPI